MRVLHAVRSDAFAGVERYVARLADAQSARGDHVFVIGGDSGAMRRETPQRVGHMPAATVVRAAVAIGTAVARTRPDVVHVHMTAAEAAGAIALLARDIPLVTTRHFGQRRGSRRLVRLATNWVGHRMDAQIAVSQWVADRVEGDCVVIHPGVPVIGVPAPLEDRERVILVAQRLEPEKCTELAVEAFAATGLADCGWRLEIAGTGSRLHDLEALADERGLTSSVEFLGHRTDVLDLMARSRMLLATAPREHFGLTVLEAMSSGLPVVAAGAAGHLETLRDVPGHALFAPGDAVQAGDLLRAFAVDEGRWSSYAGALRAKQRASFTVERQAAETERVYRSVC